jgi:hypothetical protein
MRSKLFKERVKTARICSDRWVRIFPDEGNGYLLLDPMAEMDLGRILFDAQDNWIYDGNILRVDEQEEVAGMLTGHQKEMDELIRDL